MTNTVEIETLINQLKSKNIADRMMAATTLAKMGDIRAAETVIDWLFSGRRGFSPKEVFL